MTNAGHSHHPRTPNHPTRTAHGAGRGTTAKQEKTTPKPPRNPKWNDNEQAMRGDWATEQQGEEGEKRKEGRVSKKGPKRHHCDVSFGHW